MKIQIDELRSLVIQALQTKFNQHQSNQIADVIMFGELSGKTSHGIVRLMVGDSSMLARSPKQVPEIITKTKLSKIVIGHDNPAMLVASMAMTEAIKLGQTNGFGIVGTNDTYSTSGCLSYYLEQIAKNNLIGIIMARSPLGMAPFNSIEPLFGTNPIGYGFPSNQEPLIFDMGTSAISWGALLKAKATNQPLPKNVAIDKSGKPTTDPAEAMEGSVLGFDHSYKSSGLSMVVELMAGLLPGAGYMDQKKDNDWGNLFITLSPQLLMANQEFNNHVSLFISRLKKAKTIDGKRVRISGENTLKTRDKSIKKGAIDVSEELIDQIKTYLQST